MRVLFTTTAIASHLNLMTPLAWALRAAGHEVRMASQPTLSDAVAAAGLTAVPVGNPLDTERHTHLMRADPGEPASFRAGRQRAARVGFDISEDRPERLDFGTVNATLTVFPRAVSDFLSDDAMLADLVAFARDWRPALVVWDALTYAGPIAAAVCGAAHVRSLFGPDYLGRMRRTFRRLAAERGADAPDPLREWLGPRIERHGGVFAEELVLGQQTVDPLPPWLGVETGRPPIRIRHLPQTGTADDRPWLRTAAERPRVCVTMGTTGDAFGMRETRMRELALAIAELDAEVVVTATEAELGPDLPANVRAAGFVSLDVLLPTCSAIVHHFGVGTLGAATAHAVPQLWVPDGPALWGEPDIAGRLAAHGASAMLDAATPAAVRDGVAELLGNPAYRAAARRLRDELRAVAAPASAVGRLETLAALRSGTRPATAGRAS